MYWKTVEWIRLRRSHPKNAWSSTTKRDRERRCNLAIIHIYPRMFMYYERPYIYILLHHQHANAVRSMMGSCVLQV